MADRDIVNDMLDALDRERRMILSGRFDDLERHALEKAELLHRFGHSAEALSHKDLTALRTGADRNQALLNAAANGIQAVRRRIADIRKTAGSLETYGEDGQRKQATLDRPKVERRA